MPSATLQAPDHGKVLRLCRDALRRIAQYRLEPVLDKRMRELGERKEFLDADEHAESMAFVWFAEQLTHEKLEAEIAIQRLESAYPELASTP